MIQKYEYNGKVYTTAWQVRQAINQNERLAFGPEPNDGRVEFWAQFGVTYAEEPDPEPTEEELAVAARRQRDYMLNATDYLVMPDYPLSEEDRAAVTAYRQALRDIPQSDGFPADIAWPDIPAVLSEKVEKDRKLAAVLGESR